MNQGQGPYGHPQQQGYGMQPQWPVQLWTCHVCRFQGQAMLREKVSTAGWVVFALLLLFCLPLFWIGLLIKDRVAVCPQCGTNA